MITTPRLLSRTALAGLVLLLALPLARAGGTEDAASATKPVAAPILDEECAAFGEEIAQAFNTGRTDEVVALSDPFTLCERVLRGLDLSAAERQGFRSSFVEGFRKSLARDFRQFDSARYLRTQTVAGEPRVLVRCVSPQGALNFFAFVVARRANGRLKWIDAFVYLNGETFAESARRLTLPMFAKQNAGLLARLTGSENAYLKNVPLIQKAQEKLQAGAMKEATVILDGMPAEVRATKPILLLRLRAAQKIDEATYLKVMDEWAKAYPNDPSLDLIGIDADFMREDYDGVVRRIESLQRQLGGDSYLEYLKALMLRLAGRNDECRVAVRRALADDPKMAKAYDVLLQIELDAKNHAAVAALLDEVETNFPEADMAASIANTESYAAFRAAPEYALWLDHRATKQAPTES